jgi:phage N-6-adenine-methyltransferase
VSQINSYIALVSELEEVGIPAGFTYVNFPENAARVVFPLEGEERQRVVTEIAETLRGETTKQPETVAKLTKGSVEKIVQGPNVHFSSKSQDWWTPAGVLDPVIAVLGEIDIDPCANDGPPNVPARQHFTEADDGLAQEWHGKVYLNPPYKKAAAWIAKLTAEIDAGHVTEAIVLVANRTGSDWYADLTNAARVKCELDGRLTFIDGRTGEPAKNTAPFPSVVFYLAREYADDDRDRFRRAFDQHGAVWERLEALAPEVSA